LTALHILVANPLSDVFWQRLYPILWAASAIWCQFLLLCRNFNFMWSHLSNFSLSCWAIWHLLRKSLPMSINPRVFPALSCTSYKVLGLILRSLIHFELILVQGERHGSTFSFLHADIQFSQQHLLNGLSFLHHMFRAPSKIQWCSYVESYLAHLFWSIGLHACFCANSTLFLLL
jgi:hypothetical protein